MAGTFPRTRSRRSIHSSTSCRSRSSSCRSMARSSSSAIGPAGWVNAESARSSAARCARRRGVASRVCRSRTRASSAGCSRASRAASTSMGMVRGRSWRSTRGIAGAPFKGGRAYVRSPGRRVRMVPVVDRWSGVSAATSDERRREVQRLQEKRRRRHLELRRERAQVEPGSLVALHVGRGAIDRAVEELLRAELAGDRARRRPSRERGDHLRGQGLGRLGRELRA